MALMNNSSEAAANMTYEISCYSSEFELRNQSLCNDTCLEEFVESCRRQFEIQYIYMISVPVMLFFCALTVVINLIIVVSVRWMRKPLTPTMCFSVSLAGADACASFVIGLGLFINSFLKALSVDLDAVNQCFFLVLEVMRLSGVIVTVAHLLALAINHYIGILKPFQYASIMTPKTVAISITAMWICPSLALIAHFASVEGQGFQDAQCKEITFLKQFKFRAQFATFFFVPLIFMIVIYGHIFVIVRKHQALRRKLTQRQSQTRSTTPAHRLENGSVRWNRTSSSYSDTTFNGAKGSPITWPKRPAGHRIAITSPIQLAVSESSSMPVSRNGGHPAAAMRQNIKAVITTLLIVGTCVLGWMPAVIWFITLCNDCVLTFRDIAPLHTVGVSIAVNSLIILKSLLDPIIYTLRMKDCQIAFRRMRNGLYNAISCNKRYNEATTPAHYYRSIEDGRSRRSSTQRSLYYRGSSFLTKDSDSNLLRRSSRFRESTPKLRIALPTTVNEVSERDVSTYNGHFPNPSSDPSPEMSDKPTELLHIPISSRSVLRRSNSVPLQCNNSKGTVPMIKGDHVTCPIYKPDVSTRVYHMSTNPVLESNTIHFFDEIIA